ncbi:MAG: hypothetical protein LBC61_01385 [Candidatus Peribacteria bacterium]|nr:hypothetical protein [Candidatus Peribacteria bacterium]
MGGSLLFKDTITFSYIVFTGNTGDVICPPLYVAAASSSEPTELKKVNSAKVLLTQRELLDEVV